jgi:hypothetical protein
MHSFAEGEGDEPVGLGLGLGLVGDGDGLVGEGDGLVGDGDGLVGEGDGLAEEGVADALGVGVLAGVVAGELVALELGVGLAVLVARAVRWAAHEVAAAAGAGLAMAITNPPAAPAGMTKNPEIAPSARRVMVCRLLMDTPSPPSSPSGSRSLP